MMMMRFFRWQRRCCSGKREKKPTTTSYYYLKTCVCVMCWNETLESSRCWRVAERERERERERGIRFGGWCAQKWYETTSAARKIFKEIFCATRTRETRENRREEDLFVWERKALVPWKKFQSIEIDFCEFLTNFWCFRFGLNFQLRVLLENGLIESATITH